MTHTVHVLCNTGKHEDEPTFNKETRTWTTATWAMSEVSSDAAVGGFVCIHDRQKNESRHGGRVVATHFQGIDDKGNRRYAIEYTFDERANGLKKTHGWGSGAAVGYSEQAV